MAFIVPCLKILQWLYFIAKKKKCPSVWHLTTLWWTQSLCVSIFCIPFPWHELLVLVSGSPLGWAMLTYSMMPLSTKSAFMVFFNQIESYLFHETFLGIALFPVQSSQQKSNQTIKSSSFHKVTRGSVALFPLHFFLWLFFVLLRRFLHAYITSFCFLHILSSIREPQQVLLPLLSL